MSALTLEEAKQLFYESDGSSYAMAMKNWLMYKKYCETQISKDLEIQWTKEIFKNLLNLETAPTYWVKIDCIKDDYFISEKIDKLADIAHNISEIEYYYLIFNEVNRLLSNLSNLDRVIIAETIVGRRDISVRYGLIFDSFNLGDKSLAMKFVKLANDLLNFMEKDEELVSRVSRIKIKISEVVKNL